MNKTMWARPRAQVDEFAANEYVAVCWGVACDYGESGGETGTDDPKHVTTAPHTHTSDCYIHTAKTEGDKNTGCGWLANQLITANADGSYSLVERNVEYGQSNLTIYITDSDWDNPVSTLKSAEIGQTIYWTTTNSAKNTWHHMGTIEALDAAHPNRS